MTTTNTNQTSTNARQAPAPYAVISKTITDRSGSMATFRGAQVSMTHELITDIAQQARDSGIPTYWSFTTFDDKITTHFLDVDLSSDEIVLPTVQEIRAMVQPRGSTRIIDTLMQTLAEIDAKKTEIINNMSPEVRNLNPHIATVINCITDGEDNISTYSNNELQASVAEYRTKGGEAILLAANLDAQEIARQYGFSEETALTVHNSNQESIEYAFRCAINTTREVSMGSQATPYTALERHNSQYVSSGHLNSDDSDDYDSDDYNGLMPNRPAGLTRSNALTTLAGWSSDENPDIIDPNTVVLGTLDADTLDADNISTTATSGTSTPPPSQPLFRAATPTIY